MKLSKVKNTRWTLLLIASGAIFWNCGLNAPKTDSSHNNIVTAISVLTSQQSSQSYNPNCYKKQVTAIQNIIVSNPFRYQYTMTGCGLQELNSLGFSADSISTLTSGTSSSSRITSNSTFLYLGPDNGINVEITFTLTSSSSVFDIIAYGGGSDISIAGGPTYRIMPGANGLQYKTSSGSFASFTANAPPTIQVGTQTTLCLDFEKGSMGMMMNGWIGSCASVSSVQRSSMSNFPIMQMTNVQSSVGSQLGFVLNGVSISTFTFGTIISQVGM